MQLLFDRRCLGWRRSRRCGCQGSCGLCPRSRRSGLSSAKAALKPQTKAASLKVKLAEVLGSDKLDQLFDLVESWCVSFEHRFNGRGLTHVFNRRNRLLTRCLFNRCPTLLSFPLRLVHRNLGQDLSGCTHKAKASTVSDRTIEADFEVCERASLNNLLLLFSFRLFGFLLALLLCLVGLLVNDLLVLAADELDEGHLRAIAFAFAKLEDASVAAGPL